MKRVVIIHQDSIRSYSIERRRHRDSTGEKKPEGRGLSAVKFIDRTVPTLRETVKSRARFAAREAALKQNPAFLASCETAKVKVTPRQARKWNKHQGAAYTKFREERETNATRK